MSIHIHVDTDDVDRELRRLQDGPDLGDALRFEGILLGLMRETQAVVHVITRSLKSSGRAESDLRGDVWSGQITYGGPSAGSVHDPVRYAQLEQARGDLHDFMRPTYDADDDYIRAILAFLRGGLL